MNAVKVLHVIQTMTVGGAQRSVVTLATTEGHSARICQPVEVSRDDSAWADVVVAHVWRYRKGDQHVPVPSLPGVDPARLIVFNHDVSGHISAPCALVVVYSQTAACGQIAEAPVKVLPGGIGLAGLGQVSRSRRWDQVGSLGRLSTLHDGKIAPQTIEWWPDAPVSRLVVGGQGSQFDALCEAYAATRIEFVGEVRPRSRSEFLAQLDIFCYQTEWHEESFGYVVLEALAAGCVVVTEPRGALGELVLDDVTGLLVDGSDEAAEQVTRLVADPMRCARLSAAGSRSARRYTKRAMQSSFHNMVAAVLSDGRLRDPRQ